MSDGLIEKTEAYDKMMDKLQALKAEYGKKLGDPEMPQKEGAREETETLETDTSLSQESAPEDTSEDYFSEAQRQGWVPKEKFRGNPEDWVDAKTFVERGPIFRRIQQLKESQLKEASENEKLREMVKELVGNLKSAETRVREQTLQELAKQQQIAIQNNDLRQYKEIEQHATKLGYSATSPEDASSKKFDEFISKGNSWATKDDDQSQEMRAFATLVSKKFAKENPDASVDDHYMIVHQKVRERYPNHEEFIKDSSAPKVSYSSTPKYGAKNQPKTLSESSLTTNQKSIYNYLKRNPDSGMSPEDYLKALNKRGN